MSPHQRRSSSIPTTTWREIVAQGITDKTEHYVIQGDDDARFPFIGEHHLRSIWTELFKHANPGYYTLPDAVVAIKELILHRGLLVFASILFSIGWEKWDSFHHLFVDEVTGQLKRRDADLPLRRAADASFLESPSTVEAFLERQYI